MLDPITLGIVFGGVAIVVAFYFLFSSGGDDFDKAYPNDVRKLLTGSEKDKTKAIAKGNKKQANKEKKDDKETAQAKKEVQPAKGKKSASGNNKTTTEKNAEILDSDDKPLIKISSELDNSSSTAISNSSEKSATTESQPIQAVHPVVEESVQKVQVSEKATSKKTKKAVKTENLDSGKLLAALSKIPEIDEAYINFLQTYVKDNAQSLQKVDRLQRDIERTNFEKHEMQERLSKAVHVKNAAELSLANSVKTVDELRNKYQTLSTENAEARVKINHLQQRSEQEEKHIGENVSAALAEAARWKAEFIKSKEIVEAVTVDRDGLRNLLEDFENKLIKEQQQSSTNELCSQRTIEELRSTCEDLGSRFTGHEEIVKKLTAENQELNDELAAKQTDAEDRVQTHHKETEARLEEQRAAAELEKNRIMEDCKSLQSLVEKLNSEVARFEQYKVELEEREKALAEKHGVTENSDLVAQLQEENRKLKENNLAIEAEKTLLKEKASELTQAVQYQKEKNDELRARNFAVVEHSKISCKSDASSIIDSTRAMSEVQKASKITEKQSHPTVIDMATGEHLLNLLSYALNDIDTKEASTRKQKSSSHNLVSTNMIVNEMKQCLKLKEQIRDLHESLTNISGQPTISNPSIKSDESDWELVN